MRNFKIKIIKEEEFDKFVNSSFRKRGIVQKTEVPITIMEDEFRKFQDSWKLANSEGFSLLLKNVKIEFADTTNPEDLISGKPTKADIVAIAGKRNYYTLVHKFPQMNRKFATSLRFRDDYGFEDPAEILSHPLDVFLEFHYIPTNDGKRVLRATFVVKDISYSNSKPEIITLYPFGFEISGITYPNPALFGVPNRYGKVRRDYFLGGDPFLR